MQPSRKNVSRLFLITLLLMIVAICFSLVIVKPANCWDRYQTEDEAIMHCEGVED